MNLLAATRCALSAEVRCENLQAAPNLHSPAMTECHKNHRKYTCYQNFTTNF